VRPGVDDQDQQETAVGGPAPWSAAADVRADVTGEAEQMHRRAVAQSDPEGRAHHASNANNKSGSVADRRGALGKMTNAMPASATVPKAIRGAMTERPVVAEICAASESGATPSIA